ncbi:hypothetical protein [uncultured Methanospirillum sp.]|uniref:hypothetical protein n=1 Tax=uncultured Methanospirillum sp. TaxID=262503 RepID=UPI0029C88D11|nr:hypothetical protein [uncultured Methanospirillum sp.]
MTSKRQMILIFWPIVALFKNFNFLSFVLSFRIIPPLLPVIQAGLDNRYSHRGYHKPVGFAWQINK